MFVSTRRFILKTCGTTTPLLCLPLLLSFVQTYAGYDTVQDLYYSRKNFKRPELQLTPHRSFEEEASILDQFFPGKGGRAYCLGSLKGDDCWYLYVVTPGSTGRDIMAKAKQKQNLAHRNAKYRMEPDQTLEVLMTDVDPKKMVYFYKDAYPLASDATKLSGIGNLIPGMMIDDFQFNPCGYSMNGVSRNIPLPTSDKIGEGIYSLTWVPNHGYEQHLVTQSLNRWVFNGGYMTIHVTPEPAFSYVSFETNMPHKNYKDLINRVVQIFGPKQFVVTFFSSEGGKSLFGVGDQNGMSELDNYFIEDLQICCLPGYDLSYALYNRFPS